MKGLYVMFILGITGQSIAGSFVKSVTGLALGSSAFLSLELLIVAYACESVYKWLKNR